MASLSEILSTVWKGQGWTLSGDDYATLVWAAGNSLTKPSEAEIRARSADADAIIAANDKSARQQRALYDSPDTILAGFEIIIDALIEIRRVILSLAPNAQFDSAVVSRVQAMQAKIAALRALN